MGSGLTIRAPTPADVPALVEMNRGIARETEGRDLPPDVVARGVAALLGNEALGRYFLACEGDRVVGQLMVTTEWSDWRDGVFWWIQSVYVRPESRRRGVYRALHEHVLAEAKKRGDVVGVRLYVEEHNDPAQRTYASLGMKKSGYVVMEQPLDET